MESTSEAKRERVGVSTVSKHAVALVGAISLVLALEAHRFEKKPPRGRQATVAAGTSRVAVGKAEPALRARVTEAYRKLPLSFEPNQGQSDQQVRFLTRGSGYSVFLTGNEAVLSLNKSGVRSQESEAIGSTDLTLRSAAFPGSLRPPGALAHQGGADLFSKTAAFPTFSRLTAAELNTNSALPTKLARIPKSESRAPAVLGMRLVGAKAAAKVTGLEELSGKSYYFIGNDPKKWRTNVPNYARVKYESVYPGIDLVYYGNQGQLEYDFVVAPGADPGKIALDVGAGPAPGLGPAPATLKGAATAGAAALHLADNGDLVIETDGGEVRFHKPVVYQPTAGQVRSTTNRPTPNHESRIPVDAHYVLAVGGRVGFEMAEYDHRKPLVIDPILSYSTFLGGNTPGTSGGGLAIAVDAAGNAYAAGQTTQNDFPTLNPLPPPNDALHGVYNAFVSKLAFSGTTLSLAYSTYLGGSCGDQPHGIAVDSAGNAYVAGSTCSSDFPTVNPLPAPNDRLQGSDNGFVSKLTFSNSTLSLAYSTYLGGSYEDGATGIVVDSAGNAYVTGATISTDFPVANPLPAPNDALQGDDDAFVSKLTFSGSTLSLAYSTYLGGSDLDYATGIAVDSAGNAYVTGYTRSADFPVVNPLPAPNDTLQGSDDAFVSMLSFSGSTLSLAYSTYLGGSANPPSYGDTQGQADCGTGIAVDSAGNAYVTGFTASSDFPTVNSLPAPNDTLRNLDAFVSKLSFSGSTLSLVYSTYLGGSNVDLANGIAVDSAGNAYVTGHTVSSDFPQMNPLPPPSAWGGGWDVFVSKLSFSDSTLSLSYSTFLGSCDLYGLEGGDAIAVDPAGNAYVTGSVGGDPPGVTDCQSGFPLVNPLPVNPVPSTSLTFVAKLGG